MLSLSTNELVFSYKNTAKLLKSATKTKRRMEPRVRGTDTEGWVTIGSGALRMRTFRADAEGKYRDVWL